MQAIPALPERRTDDPGATVAIGSFDGVHAGHRRIVRRLAAEARRRALRAIVITFDPHPRCVLDPERCPASLGDVDGRAALLRGSGADTVIVLEFTRELSTWTADRFADALVGSLGMCVLVAGPGFALGHRRTGDVEHLRRRGAVRGFDVLTVTPAMLGGRPVSSTRVREALTAGRLGEANRLLGRRYSLTGQIVRGDARGAGLGVPTANLRIPSGRCLPAPGVYAAWLDAGDGWMPAATGIGTRPTFGGGPVTVEAHVLDFEGDLYGRTATLALVRRLRGERRFGSAAALTRAMRRDIEHTRHLLSARPPR